MQFVVAHDGVGLNAAMRGGAGIVLESGQRYLFRFHAAADLRAILQHDNAVARLGQICRRDQTVVPRAGHDDIEFVGRSCLRRQAKGREGQRRKRRRAFREYPDVTFCSCDSRFM